MGSLSNNGRKLANFAGFYKGIQSAGAAGMWRYVARHSPKRHERLANKPVPTAWTPRAHRS